ncbi:MAG: enoyl-CoA hydratase-related protein [Candidatus Eiseniibacteriota bacterium]|jgi:enoyl-CoA hydratase
MGEATATGNVRLTVAERIATVTIHRPEVLNALNRKTMEDLDEILLEVGRRDDVGGLVVTGAGERAFVAGADIGELAALDAPRGRAVVRHGQSVLNRLERLGKPSVAAINGYALGGGCELALACTLRVASEKARIGLPEVTLGVIPGYGGTQRLARLIGRGRALELILTGEPVSAARALELGLVNQVVAAADVESAARELLATILARGPLAVRAAMEVVRVGLDGDLDAGLALEAAHFGLLCGTEDMHEGMQAFLDKRPAAFRGR